MQLQMDERPMVDAASETSDSPDLASKDVGGAVVWANDEFFASKDNLVKSSEPVFKEGKYTDRGKWMDGWETRRRREPGHDRCVVRLGLPGVIERVVVDTAHFEGNYPEHCSLEGAYLEGHPPADEIAEDDSLWTEIVDRSKLVGDAKNTFDVEAARAFTHLRFHIYPAGGVARLRVHGEAMPELERLRRLGEYDLAGVQHGGRVVEASDEFFGAASNLLLPGRAENMGDGWETRRTRGSDPDEDWVTVALAAEGELERIEVDTEHFKGNYPATCRVEGARTDEGEPGSDDWCEVLAETELRPHTLHAFEEQLRKTGPFTHLRLTIAPDGGLARFRAFGRLNDRGWEQRKLRQLDTFPARRARETFLACCGSEAWAEAMEEGRPYGSLDALMDASDEAFDALETDDWLEAFAAHPRIGDDAEEGDQTEKGEAWSDEEQSGTEAMDETTEEKLERLNREYYDKFGFIFIVFASGKSAEEMVTILEDRIAHDRETEIEIASQEQQKITENRLQKLVRP